MNRSLDIRADFKFERHFISTSDFENTPYCDAPAVLRVLDSDSKQAIASGR